MDGLRGLAALQVLLLHYTAAFLPVTARVAGGTHYAWEQELSRSPAFVLIDGYSAVYLFFIMSGFVLAASFTRSQSGFFSLAAKRFARLFLPVFFALCIALLLLLWLPDAPRQATMWSQSAWLAGLAQGPWSAGVVAKDLLVSSMLVGYEGTSVFAGWAMLPPWLAVAPIAHALNAPMWTLHVEFWGSMLVLAAAMLRRNLSRGWFWIIFFGAGLALGPGHFWLFLFGFLLYEVRKPLLALARFEAQVLGAMLIVAGLYICASKDVSAVSALLSLGSAIWIAGAVDTFHGQSQFGASVVFLGVMICPAVRDAMNARAIQWMGKVSFSVYLLHFPVMLTLGCSVFALLAPISNGFACLAGAVVGAVVTFISAAVFERRVDRVCQDASKRWSDILQVRL